MDLVTISRPALEILVAVAKREQSIAEAGRPYSPDERAMMAQVIVETKALAQAVVTAERILALTAVEAKDVRLEDPNGPDGA